MFAKVILLVVALYLLNADEGYVSREGVMRTNVTTFILQQYLMMTAAQKGSIAKVMLRSEDVIKTPKTYLSSNHISTQCVEFSIRKKHCLYK